MMLCLHFSVVQMLQNVNMHLRWDKDTKVETINQRKGKLKPHLSHIWTWAVMHMNKPQLSSIQVHYCFWWLSKIIFRTKDGKNYWPHHKITLEIHWRHLTVRSVFFLFFMSVSLTLRSWRSLTYFPNPPPQSSTLSDTFSHPYSHTFQDDSFKKTRNFLRDPLFSTSDMFINVATFQCVLSVISLSLYDKKRGKQMKWKPPGYRSVSLVFDFLYNNSWFSDICYYW